MAVGRGCLTKDANNGDGDEGGGQATAMRAMATVMVMAMAVAMAMAMTWAMEMAIRLAGDKVGKGRVERVARAMAKVMGVAGDEEGEDGKAMEMGTRMVGQWTVTPRKRAIATATRVAGEQGGW